MKNFYSFLQKKMGRVEEDLYAVIREEKYKSFKFYFYDVFVYLAFALQYMFFGFLEFLIKFFVLIFKTPKEAYEILVAPLEKLALDEERIKRQMRPFPEFVEYHKKARLLSNRVFGVLIVAVVVVSVIITLMFPVGVKVLGATYTWSQTNWGGGGTANNAIHPTNSSGWTEYSSVGSGIVAVNGGADLELASTTASVLKTSDTDFSGGTFATTTVNGSGSSASVKLTKALHINEYTIGSANGSTAYNVSVTATSVTANSNGTWTIAFSGTPNLSRIFKNDKFTDSGSLRWKVLSVAPDVYKIIVVDSEGNIPTVSAPATGSGTVGRWYASISAWEAGRNADITATGRNAIERGLPYYDGAADTTIVTIGNWTTDATHYIEIYVPLSERHRGKWDNNKYRLESTGTNFNLQARNVRIDGLQMKLFYSTTGTGIYLSNLAAPFDVRISNNIIQGVGSGSPTSAEGINLWGNAGGSFNIWNNIIYNFNTNNVGFGINAQGGAFNAYVYNNTFYNNYKGISQTGSSVITAKNNIVQGATDGYFGITGAGSDYNISDLSGDAPGANSKNSTVVPFASSSQSDFHLDFRDGTGNPAMNAGADLSADASLAFTTDIDGDTRSGTWDIGADDVGATLVMTHSIGATGRDFANLQAWEDARDGVLTTRNMFKISGQTGAFIAGETITGGTSGATGTYIPERATPSISEIYMTVDKVNATAFVAGETLTGGTSLKTATLSTILTTAGTIEKGEAYNDSTFTAGVAIGGSTTDANHYMWLTVEPRSRHRGVAGTGAKIEASFVTGNVINNLSSYTIIEWLEVSNLRATGGGYVWAFYENWPADYWIIRNNLIHSVNFDGDFIGIRHNNTSGLSRSAYNNIIYGGQTGIKAVTNGFYYNNTIFPIVRGFIRESGNPLLKNNIVVGSSIEDISNNGGTWNTSSSNNISSDATATSTGSSYQINKSVSDLRFVSTASDFVDLHILDGSVAKDAGADLSATFKNDIDGAQDRSGTYDAGADEWFSSSPVYNSSGTFTSGTIDLGSAVNFDTLAWNPTSTQPISADVKFAVAAKNTDSGWQDSDFVDLNQEAYPTGVTVHTSYIRPSGQCTGYSPCYNSLSAWEAAQNRDLVASNEIELAQIGGNWTSPDTTVVNIGGWTTNATHYIRIYTTPEARHNGKWSNDKYRLVSSASQVFITNGTEVHHIKIDGLQIQHTITNANWDYTINLEGGDGSDVSISNNILKGVISGTSVNPVIGIMLSWYASGTRTAKIWNNVIYDYSGSAGTETAIYQIGWQPVYYYNNTVYNSDVGFYLSGQRSLKNNITYNNTNSYSINAGTYFSSSNNLSGPGSDVDIPSDGARNGVSVTFIDAAGGDFRLASSDTGARNYGTSSVSEIGFATDIEGHLRSSSSAGGSWDIGAHEYGATGGAVPASLDNNRYLRYKAYLSTSDSAFTPQLDDLTVNYNYYATTSPALISSPYNSNDGTNILGKIAWTATTTSGTEVRFQVRSSPDNIAWSQWCGESACDDTDYFAAADNNVDLTPGHPLKNGGNDKWLQYKAIFVSTGASTPTLGDVTLTYVVNAPPVISTPTASQRTSDGKVVVDFTGYDTDTATGTAHPNQVSLTMEYWNGSTWTSATSLTGSTGWTAVSSSAGSPTTYQLIWDAKTDFSGMATTTAKIRVTANDGEGANNTNVVQSVNFSLDTKNPVATLKVDGTFDGQNGAIAYVITDDNTAQCKGSNNSDYSADGLNVNSGSWVTTTTSTTTWDFASSEPVKIYSQCRDVYLNSVTLTSEAPITPANIVIRDSSDVAENQFREFISWDVSSSSDFASYKVYRSTDGTNYFLHSTITDVNQNFLTDGSSGAWLIQGTTYYYKVLVLDSDVNYSRYSSVVSDVVDGQGGTDVTSPTISNVSVSGIGTSQATVSWTTDELSDSVVYYSTNLSYGTSKSSVSLVTSHSVTLTGLTPGTTYNLRLKSTDPSSNYIVNDAATPGTGNLAGSFSFTTSAGPVISSVSVSSIAGTSATVVWNTDVDADSFVEYSVNSNLSSSQNTGSASLVGGAGPLYGHSVTLTGLTIDTKYYFKVKSTNSGSQLAQDNNGGSYYTFTTVKDITPPVISSVSATLVDNDSAVITWVTNELADSQVMYGAGSASNPTVLDTAFTTSHSVGLSSLSAQTAYSYQVISRDRESNQTTSATYTFTTTQQTYIRITAPPTVEAQPSSVADITVTADTLPTKQVTQTVELTVDREAPTVLNLSVSEISESSARITWDTDEPTTSLVEYGETTVYGFTQGDYDFKTSHDVTLKNLHPGTDYNYRIRSFDNVGNFTESANKVFKTLSAKESIEERIAKLTEVTDIGQVTTLTKEIEKILATLSDKILPPLIVGDRPDVDISSSFAVIKWNTDRPSGSIVAYSEEKDYIPDLYVSLIGDAEEQTTTHDVLIANLKPGTTYHFQLRSKALVGGVGKSKDFTFTTKAEAGISDLLVSEIKTDSAIISWKTTVPATTRLEYGLTSDYSKSKTDDAFNASHIVRLANLNPGTLYRYRVGGVDQNTKQFFSPNLTFVTEALPSLLNVSVESVEDKGVSITWYTDVAADSTVVYTNQKTGKTTSYGDKQFIKNHNVQLEGLEQGTEYKLQVVSKDEKGNEVKSSEYSFATSKDVQAPMIFNVQTQSAIFGRDKVQTIISWKTEEPATSQVIYQEGSVKDSNLEKQSKLNQDLSTTHTAVFTNFKPGAVYRFHLENVDQSGNIASSKDFSILTPQREETVFDLIIQNFRDVFRWTERLQ